MTKRVIDEKYLRELIDISIPIKDVNKVCKNLSTLNQEIVKCLLELLKHQDVAESQAGHLYTFVEVSEIYAKIKELEAK